VSIVDDRGALLARATGEGEEGAAGLAASTADERRLELEQRMARKIEEQIERAVGAGRVRAEVALEMDFDRVVTSSESFDPDGQVVRSQQTVSENNESSEAANNQGVSVANNVAEAEAAPGGGGGQNRSRSTRQEETINYEIARKTTNHVREVGTIRRLSASVVVDGIVTVGSDGKASYQPRNPEQLEQLRLAARAAVGFNERRGDTLELINLPFAGNDAGGVAAEAGMFDFSRGEILRMSELAILFIVALLVILLVARPLIGAIGRAGSPAAARTPPGQPGALPPAAGDGPPALTGPTVPGEGNGGANIDLDRIDGRLSASSMKKIGEIVEKHPDETVSIIRNWMYQEAN
jgi:flagellar M-ring protein FliF